jgi:hypothetical protein
MADTEVATTDTSAANGAVTADDAALIAAMQEAQGEGTSNDDPPPEPTKPDAPSSKHQKKAPKAEEPAEEGEDAIPSLAEVLEKRVERHKQREEIQSLKAETEKMRSELQVQLSEAKREREAAARELQRIHALKADPIRAIKELGWDTQDLVNRVVQDGTPEFQQLSRQEQAAQKLQEQIEELRSWKVEQQKLIDDYAKKQAAATKAQVYEQFMGVVKEQAPTLSEYYDREYIVFRGDQVADEYRQKTGKDASLAEIAQYLEYEAQKRFKKAATGKEAASATGKRANGSRTLSAQAASERRSAPKAYHELPSEAEKDKALEEAVIEAMRDAG